MPDEGCDEEPGAPSLPAPPRTNLQPTAETLGTVLDSIAAGDQPKDSLRQVREEFLRQRELAEHYDWRYYLVRYDVMRMGTSGIYASVGGNMGYLVCMLEKTQMNGQYRDPYLTALSQEAGAESRLVHGTVGPVYTGGHIECSRWMSLSRSGTSIRCTSDGWVLKRPEAEDYQAPFESVSAAFGLGTQLKLTVAQQVHDGRRVDAADRVKAAAQLLRALATAGL